MRAPVLGVLLAVALVACAGTVRHELQRQSARAITPTPYPDSVTISDIRRDRLGNVREWVATARGGAYDCSLEDRERQALCVRREPAH